MAGRNPWWEAYERTTGRMHVCMYAFCVCDDCRIDPQLRRDTAIRHEEPQTRKPIFLLDTVAEALGGDDDA
jgi:hypothetical protein